MSDGGNDWNDPWAYDPRNTNPVATLPGVDGGYNRLTDAAQRATWANPGLMDQWTTDYKPPETEFVPVNAAGWEMVSPGSYVNRYSERTFNGDAPPTDPQAGNRMVARDSNYGWLGDQFASISKNTGDRWKENALAIQMAAMIAATAGGAVLSAPGMAAGAGAAGAGGTAWGMGGAGTAIGSAGAGGGVALGSLVGGEAAATAAGLGMMGGTGGALVYGSPEFYQAGAQLGMGAGETASLTSTGLGGMSALAGSGAAASGLSAAGKIAASQLIPRAINTVMGGGGGSGGGTSQGGGGGAGLLGGGSEGGFYKPSAAVIPEYLKRKNTTINPLAQNEERWTKNWLPQSYGRL
jgi:hypothetical protein